MSLLLYTAVFVSGLFVGPMILKALGNLLPAGYGAKVGKWFLNSGLRMGEAWIANETAGQRYELVAVSQDTEDGANVLKADDDRVWEDVGLMGHLDTGGQSVPFGTTFDESRVISSPLVSKIGESYGELATDGGIEDLESGEKLDEDRSVQWFRDNALLARARDGNHIVEVVNGAAEIPTAAVANVRDTVSILSHGGDPEQPKRTADNAENAERERRGDKGLMGHVGRLGYVFVGGLLVWFAMRDGGGGGGGVSAPDAGDVPATIAPAVVDGLMSTLSILPGVIG